MASHPVAAAAALQLACHASAELLHLVRMALEQWLGSSAEVPSMAFVLQDYLKDDQVPNQTSNEQEHEDAEQLQVVQNASPGGPQQGRFSRGHGNGQPAGSPAATLAAMETPQKLLQPIDEASSLLTEYMWEPEAGGGSATAAAAAAAAAVSHPLSAPATDIPAATAAAVAAPGTALQPLCSYQLDSPGSSSFAAPVPPPGPPPGQPRSHPRLSSSGGVYQTPGQARTDASPGAVPQPHSQGVGGSRAGAEGMVRGRGSRADGVRGAGSRAQAAEKGALPLPSAMRAFVSTEGPEAVFWMRPATESGAGSGHEALGHYPDGLTPGLPRSFQWCGSGSGEWWASSFFRGLDLADEAGLGDGVGVGIGAGAGGGIGVGASRGSTADGSGQQQQTQREEQDRSKEVEGERGWDTEQEREQEREQELQHEGEQEREQEREPEREQQRGLRQGARAVQEGAHSEAGARAGMLGAASPPDGSADGDGVAGSVVDEGPGGGGTGEQPGLGAASSDGPADGDGVIVKVSIGGRWGGGAEGHPDGLGEDADIHGEHSGGQDGRSGLWRSSPSLSGSSSGCDLGEAGAGGPAAAAVAGGQGDREGGGSLKLGEQGGRGRGGVGAGGEGVGACGCTVGLVGAEAGVGIGLQVPEQWQDLEGAECTSGLSSGGSLKAGDASGSSCGLAEGAAELAARGDTAIEGQQRSGGQAGGSAVEQGSEMQQDRDGGSWGAGPNAQLSCGDGTRTADEESHAECEDPGGARALAPAIGSSDVHPGLGHGATHCPGGPGVGLGPGRTATHCALPGPAPEEAHPLGSPTTKSEMLQLEGAGECSEGPSGGPSEGHRPRPCPPLFDVLRGLPAHVVWSNVLRRLGPREWCALRLLSREWDQQVGANAQLWVAWGPKVSDAAN